MSEEKYINNDWQNILEDEFTKKYFKDLQLFLDKEYKERVIYPTRNCVFEALELTPFENVKVVIVGQDPSPYHASGVAFSVKRGSWVPPSVKNILDLLKKDLGYAPVEHGCFESWASQGVLLLNSILTVRHGEILSHEGVGWETFTNVVIEKLCERKREEPIVFILWGNKAHSKRRFIRSGKHKVITNVHPNASGYDENETRFFDSKPFSEANEWLIKYGGNDYAINWELPQ